MARTTLTKTTPVGSYGTYSAAAAKMTMTAADVANKNQFVATGHDLVVAYNSGGSPYTVTITSAPDEFGRSGDITTYSVPAGETHIFGPFKLPGWQQTDGKIYLEASNASILFGVITLPVS